MGKNKQKRKHKENALQLAKARGDDKGIRNAVPPPPKAGSPKRSEDQVLQKETVAAATVYAETVASKSVSSADSSAVAEWQEGDVILDLYEVKGLLGEGGMGKVYRVHHTGWNIDLAVKTPRPEIIGKAGAKENFIREAETWVNLGLHPHTVSCYYVRDLGGIPRVFAECVEGGTLSDWIHTRKLYEGGAEKALERILDVAIQFAWGLSYAHEQGLVHQDVKPGNVMMSVDGIAKVTDFGLARAKGSAEGQVGLVAGGSILVESGGLTRAYASPEQAAGKHLSRKTDIWSWAVSVLEMFAGEVTWMSGEVAADALEVYLENGAEDAQIPRMPKGVSDLLRHCFQENPQDRSQDMMRVADLLQVIYEEIGGETYPRQRPKAAEGIADSLNNRAVSLMDLGKQEEAERLWDEALRVQPHHPESTYNFGLTKWRCGKQDDVGLIKQLEEVRDSQGEDWPSNYLLALTHLERDDCEEAIKILEGMGGADSDSEEVRTALLLAKERLPQSMRLLRVLETEEHIGSVCLTNDGRYALVSRDVGNLEDESYRPYVIDMWEVETGRCLRTFEGHNGAVSSICISPDGRLALSGSADATLKLWDLETGRCLRTLEGHRGDVVSAYISSDDGYALSGSHDGTLKLWELDTGRCKHTYEDLIIRDGSTKDITKAVVSDDWHYILTGRYLFLKDKAEPIKLMEVGTGSCQRIFEAGGYPLAMSRDGLFALSVAGYDIDVWDIKTGCRLQTFKGHVTEVWGVELSHDGRYAVSIGGYNKSFQVLDETLKLWTVETGRCLRTFHTGYTEEGGLGQMRELSLSRDSRYALVGGHRSGRSESSASILKFYSIASPADLYRSPLMLTRVQTAEKFFAQEAIYERELELGGQALGRGDSVSALRHVREARSQPGHSHSKEAMRLLAKLYLRLPCKTFRDWWEVETWDWEDEEIGQVTIHPSWEPKKGERFWLESEHKNGPVSLKQRSTHQTLRTFEGDGWRNCFCKSPDERYVILNSGATIRVFEIKTGQCIRTLEGHGAAVQSLCVSNEGKLVLSGWSDATLKLWDLETGRCLRTFEGHQIDSGTVIQEGVWSVCLSADGRHALSGGADQTIRVWEIETGRCLSTLDVKAGRVTEISISQDSRYALVVGLLSGETVVKDLVLDWELEEREPADWDEGAKPSLEVFLTRHTPYAATLPEDREPTEQEITLALTRRGKPVWTEKHFEDLLYTLGCAGYGWLRPEGVRRELERMASELNTSHLKDETISQDTRDELFNPNRSWWRQFWKS